MRILTATLLALAAACAANAQSFLPFGGYEGNTHLVLEPSVAGYATNGDAILSHGSIPAVSLYNSGIEAIADGISEIKATVTSDGTSVVVDGLKAEAGYELFATDGRLMAAGTVAPRAAIALPGAATATYILRVTPAGGAPLMLHFLKK